MAIGDIHKRVTFEVEDAGVMGMMTRLRQESGQLASDLISDARRYSQSSREQTSYIEEQIRAIEKRNRTELDANKLVLERRMQSQLREAGTEGERDDIVSAYKEGVGSLQSAAREDDLQIKLLREIIDTLKLTAREEIRDNKQTIEKAIITAERRGGIDQIDDDLEGFKRTFQRDLIGQAKEAEVEEESRFRIPKDRLERQVSYGAGIASRPNEFYIAAALAGLIPVIGGGASDLLTDIISQGAALERGRDSTRAVTGRSIGEGRGASFGLTQAEVLGSFPEIARSLGTSENIRTEGVGLLATEKAYGLNKQLLLEMAGIQRFEEDRNTVFQSVQDLVQTLEDTGAFGESGRDFARLEELLRIQNRISLSQSEILEDIDTDSNLQIIRAFQRVGGSFADQRAGGRIEQINRGLVEPEGDFRQAFSFSILRDLFPDSSLFELIEKREQGLATPGYFQSVMEHIMARTGDQESQMLQLMQFFPGMSAAQTRTLFESFQRNPNLFAGVGANLDTDQVSLNEVVRQASSVTGTIDRSTAVKTDLFAGFGEQAIRLIDAGIRGLRDFINAINDSSDAMNKNNMSNKNSTYKTEGSSGW